MQLHLKILNLSVQTQKRGQTALKQILFQKKFQKRNFLQTFLLSRKSDCFLLTTWVMVLGSWFNIRRHFWLLPLLLHFLHFTFLTKLLFQRMFQNRNFFQTFLLSQVTAFCSQLVLWTAHLAWFNIRRQFCFLPLILHFTFYIFNQNFFSKKSFKKETFFQTFLLSRKSDCFLLTTCIMNSSPSLAQY